MRLDLPTPEVPMNTAVSPGLINADNGFMPRPLSAQTASTDALIEAQAFLGRCLKPSFDLYRNGILNKDVNFYLRKRGGLSASAAESVTAKILPALQGHTNLRLLDDAIEAAEAALDRKGNVERLDDLVIKKVVEKTTGVREVGE